MKPLRFAKDCEK